jgi:hypothetical protein
MADMANPKHVAAFSKLAGPATQRGQPPPDGPFDLSGVNFRELSKGSMGDDFGHYTYIESGPLCDANLRNASLAGIRFRGCDFSGADLTEATCEAAFFENCTFAGANLQSTDFYRAMMLHVDLAEVKNAELAKNLDTVRVIDDVYNFDLCQRSPQAKWLSWEVIRTIGRLRVFTVSISLLGVLLIAVQWAGLYNDQVRLVLSWAEEATTRGNEAEQLLGRQIQQYLRPFHFSLSTTWLFVGVLLLGIASAVYGFACPDEIKEFTRSQWQHSLKKNVLHYWVSAWKRKYLRYLCAAFYVFGGLIFLALMAWKLGLAFWYVAGYGRWLPF